MLSASEKRVAIEHGQRPAFGEAAWQVRVGDEWPAELKSKISDFVKRLEAFEIQVVPRLLRW